MKPGRVFWGVSLLALGLLVLAEKADILAAQWSVAVLLWPIVLVFWGVTLLVGGRSIRIIAAGVAGLVLAYFLVALFNYVTLDGEDGEEALTDTSQVFVVPQDTAVSRASFVLESGAGIFTVRDTTTHLLHVATEANLGRYMLDESADIDQRTYKVWMEGRKKGWRLGRTSNRVVANLSTVPVWDMILNIGAAKLTCDLSPFHVERLEVNGGASSMSITLGDRSPATTVVVNAGASSIRIFVPEAAACELTVESALSSKRFPGFTRTGDHTYRTENFGEATKTIAIEIDAGVSSIAVERY